jgi:hypothetical protein
MHPDSGRAFVGDVAGVQIPPSAMLIPPTPPPDIDIEAWHRSLETVQEWQPDSLGITHFGAIDDPPAHLDRMSRELSRWTQLADDLGEPEFEHLLREETAAGADPETAASYLQAVPPQYQYAGLHRYLQRD